MSDEAASFTVHQLRRLGGDYLRRANAVMEHARHAGKGGGAYVPLPETAAEHAGQYVLSGGSLKGGLAALDYQLAHLDPGEDEALWRAARAILEASIARATAARGGTAAADAAEPDAHEHEAHEHEAHEHEAHEHEAHEPGVDASHTDAR